MSSASFDDVAQHQLESENSMPQPLGTEQEILFRNLAFWQEKIAVLKRFNQLETWAEVSPIDAPPSGKLLQVFDKIQKS